MSAHNLFKTNHLEKKQTDILLCIKLPSFFFFNIKITFNQPVCFVIKNKLFFRVQYNIKIDEAFCLFSGSSLTE